MSHKQNVERLFHELALEVHSFIASSESGFSERWVPADYQQCSWWLRRMKITCKMDVK